MQRCDAHRVVPELGQHLATWVAHDMGHLAQIARIVALQYREAVGPWRAYFSLMRDR